MIRKFDIRFFMEMLQIRSNIQFVFGIRMISNVLISNTTGIFFIIFSLVWTLFFHSYWYHFSPHKMMSKLLQHMHKSTVSYIEPVVLLIFLMNKVKFLKIGFFFIWMLTSMYSSHMTDRGLWITLLT